MLLFHACTVMLLLPHDVCKQVCAALGERARTATAEVPHMFDSTHNNGSSSSGAEYWNARHYSNSNSHTVHSNLQQQQQWLDVNVPSPAHEQHGSGIGTFNTDVLGTDDDDQ
jgi:hypothetical protein